MKTRLWQIILIFLLIVRCNGDDHLDQTSETDEPEVTEIGTSLGDPVTTDIGPAGGSLTSEDERLTITVPPGAVSSNTTFSIEPIVDFCPGGISSYRLLPEGLTFGVPVTLTFHYTEEDVEGTLSDFLEIAYQGSDRIWYSLTWVTVDEQAKTISAPVKHFTLWSVASKLRIEPQKPAIPVIEKGSTYGLHLAGAKDKPTKKEPPENPGDEDEGLVTLPKRKQIPFQATWYVNGVTNGNQNVGTISVADKIHVTYHAPEEVPANNPVLITAELTDFEAWSKVEGKVIKHNKVVLFKRIKIKPDEYNFTLEIGYNADMACGYPGQLYKDTVTMHVQVKNENGNDMVIVTNIVNQDATVKPFQISKGECTISCFTGGTGSINVTNGTGYVISQADELVINLLNTNTTSVGVQTDCPNHQQQNPPLPGGDYGMPLKFRLSSTEDQIINLSDPKGLRAKLSPK